MDLANIISVICIVIGAFAGSFFGSWLWRATNYERTRLMVAQILLEAELKAHKEMRKPFGSE